MIGIYKIVSPTGRVYVGQSINIEKRQESYRRGINYKNQTKLYNSILKYGFSEHIFEVIEQCSVEDLNIRERYWQDLYNVLEEGLNCKLTKTDDKSGEHSNETKKRQSKTMLEKGYKPLSRQGIPSPLRGRTLPDSHKENLRKATQGVKKTPQKKLKCPYCNLEGGATNLKRFHFNKCKKK
jgi:group I intron endonuclease